MTDLIRRKILKAGAAATVLAAAPGGLAQQAPQGGAAESGVFNVKDFGALGSGNTDDTNACQAAISAAFAAGGGKVWFPAGTYRLTRALTIIAPNALTGIRLCGAAVGASTLQQTTPSEDVLSFGQNSQEVSDFMEVSDLALSGGRYGLNLNNTLHSRFARLSIGGGDTGIYLQGQIESNRFEHINIDGVQTHGIYGSTSNGSAGAHLDFPEVQKCVFDTIRVANVRSGEAIWITAGVYNGVTQQSSGFNELRHILLEGNNRTGIRLSYAFNTSVDGATNEDHLDADNTYYALLCDHNSRVFAKRLFFARSPTKNYKAFVYNESGYLMLSESVLGAIAPAVTADLLIGDHAFVWGVNVTNTSAIAFTNTSARRNSVFMGMTDASNNPLQWSAGFGFVVPGGSGNTGNDADTAVMGNTRIPNLRVAAAGPGPATRLQDIVGGPSDAALLRLDVNAAQYTMLEFRKGGAYAGNLSADATAVSLYNLHVAPGVTSKEASGVHVMQLPTDGVAFGIGTRTLADFGGGLYVLAIRKTGTPPSMNPTNAGILYVDDSGNLKYRGLAGSVTNIAPA